LYTAFVPIATSRSGNERSKRALTGLWSALPAFLLVACATPGVGQIVCPQASAPDADAGWTAYGANDIQGARARFEAALARCPADPYARTGLGYVALREGADSVAVVHWTAVIAAEPNNLDALTGLGLAAWRRGDVVAVRARFERVLELNPGNATAVEYMGRLVLPGAPPPRPPLVLADTLVYPARTNGDRFEVRSSTGWTPFYIKGVNLGAALPGKHPSEFPDSATYAHWIRRMAEMHANAVRVYTIHPPAFYQALHDWNARNPSQPLWLIHGVWAEPPPRRDFGAQAYESDFFAEMRRVVDLLHGRADIQPRPGHAAGYYTADVSAWTLAYIIGREWEPFDALGFDSIRGHRGGFDGEYVRVRGGNAMDAWMGRAIENLVAYETRTYRSQRPVAYTNWPTLDPLAHPTEATVDEEMAIRVALGETPKVREREYDNDALALDAALVEPTDRLPAGYFASFHAYPYYPDFMILEDGYQSGASSMGRSNYFAYLTALKWHHGDMPVVISEYGVPAALGIGHLQPQGWHHGGLTEDEVAQIDRRLTLEIAEAGLAGGALFAWIDEWFKQSWLTIEFQLPADRTRLWHNRLNAEQHYGVVAMEAEPPFSGATLAERLPAWAAVEPLYDEPSLDLRVAHDASYLWLLVDHPSVDSDTVFVGFDVVDARAGDFRWPGGTGQRLPAGLELALRATPSEVRILADPSSNPFRLVAAGQGARLADGRRTPVDNPPLGLFHARAEQRFNFPYYTVPNDDGAYDSLRVLVNRRRFARDSTEFLAIGYDRGLLPGGPAPDGYWERGGTALEVRIPWTLLNVTDPSSRTVLQGPGRANARGAELGGDGVWRLRPGVTQWPDSVFGELGTRQVDGIGVVAAVKAPGGWTSAPSAGRAVARYSWPTWEAPEWVERERPTYAAMQDTYGRLDPYGVGAATPTTERRTSPGPSALEPLQSDPANEAWLRGDMELARRLYEERLARDPDDGAALHRVALVRAWGGEYHAADRLFEHLIEVEPANLDARVDRARVWAWAGDTERALDAIEELLEENPTHAGALEARALFAAWSGQFEESLSTYEALLAIAPDNVAARRQQAIVLTWASRFDASRAVYDSLLARDPTDTNSRLGLANTLAFSDSLDAAVAEYDSVLAIDPTDVRALQGKGRTLGWANRLVEAEETYRLALDMDPSDVSTAVGLAQILRWQDRHAAALEVLRTAEAIEPTNADLRAQLLGIEQTQRPVAQPSFIWEDDSDGNVMLTSALSAAWHPAPRVELQADGYHRALEQGPLGRSAMGVTLGMSYQVEPGWTVSIGGGGSRTDRAGTRSFAAYRAGLRSPARHRLVFGASFASAALDATAALAERGVTTKGLAADARWLPSVGWRIDAAVGWTRFEGAESNDRTNGLVAVTRQLSRGFSVSASARAFTFERDLTEGYFDPDFYGIGEVAGRWLGQTGPWSLLLEVAPGAQQITQDGDVTAAIRGSARGAYRFAPGRELSLAFGYSSAGLQSFSTGDADYRYMALVSGVSWVF
jgi:tetratricopeptide (TPR) repeat protein